MFERLWRAIKGLFCAEPPVIHKPGLPPLPASGNDEAEVALYVGHTPDAQGANNYLGESEYSFYSRVFDRLAKELKHREHSVLVFKHSITSYTSRVWAAVRNLKKHNVKKCVFGHFNAYYSPTVQGFEALIAKTDTLNDNAMGEKFAEMMNEAFGIDLRGYKGTKTIAESHSGAKMLYETSRAGIDCVLIEALFATHETEMTRYFFSKEGTDKFVNLLADYCEWLIKQK